MNRPVIADVTEMLEDAILRFVAAASAGHYDTAQRFLELVFYLDEHRIAVPR